MEVTIGMVVFAITVVGALFGVFMWIWKTGQEKAVRDNNTDTTLNNHTKTIIDNKAEANLKIAESNLKIEKLESAINTKVEKAEVAILKAQKNSKKKLVKQLKTFDAELKRFEKHELDIQKISSRQTQSEKDLNEIKRQVTDTLKAVQANSEISAGILANVENINKQYETIIKSIASKRE